MSIADAETHGRLRAVSPLSHPATAPAGLLDRDQELAVLRHLGERLNSQVSALVIVEGRMGTGKTSLVDAWAAGERERGLLVARASGTRLHSHHPFALVRQLLGSLLSSLSQTDRRALREKVTARPLSALRDGAHRRRRSPAEVLAEISYGLYELIRVISVKRPMVLVVDDAQWADQASLRWLCWLTGHMDGLPLMLVTTRSRSEASETGPLLDEIATRPGSVLLELSPLSRGSVTRLVRQHMGPQADEVFCTACRDASGGNPLVLGELLRVLAKDGVEPCRGQAGRVAETGEDVLVKTLLARLTRQSDAVLAMSRALAVLDDGARFADVAVLAGVDLSHARRAVRDLGSTGVLVEDETGLRFAHHLIRTNLLLAMSPGQIAEAHARAARVLRGRGVGCEKLARHLMFSPPSGEKWRVGAFREAARAAAARGVPDIAAGYLRHALEETGESPARVAVLAELARIEVMQNPAAAVHHFEEELALRRDVTERVRAAGGLATALSLVRRAPDAVAVLRQALAELETAQDHERGHEESRLRLEAQLVMAAWQDAGSASVAVDLVRTRSPHLLDGATPGERAWLAVAALHARGHGDVEQARALAHRALSGGLDLDGTMQLASLPLLLLFVAADRPKLADGWFQRMADDAARRGSGTLSATASYGLATVALHSGQLRTGLEHARALLDTRERAGSDQPAYPPTGAVANLLLDLGAGDLAHDLLRAGARHGIDDDSWSRGPYLLAQGRLLLRRKDPNAALAALLECGRHEQAGSLVSPAMSRWRGYTALAHAAVGDHASALDTASRQVRLARRWGGDTAIGVSLRTLGRVTGGPRGLKLLCRSVDVLERSPDRLELAAALRECGLAHQGLGHFGPARSAFQRALAVAEECGADHVAEGVRAALRLAGGRVPKARGSGPRWLTPSEHRVAELAARGLTNREIARALVVTLRTVEVHLTSSYRKLGIAGRAELVEALGRVGDPAERERARPSSAP